MSTASSMPWVIDLPEPVQPQAHNLALVTLVWVGYSRRVLLGLGEGAVGGVRVARTGWEPRFRGLYARLLGGPAPVRVTAAFKRLLRLDGVNVTEVIFGLNVITVMVVLRRRRLVCPHCGHKTRWRYDTRPFPSSWRHLDLGVWRVQIQATLRRLVCPTHGVVVEAVPFASPGAHLTRDLDDLLAWLAAWMDKTAIARLCRVSWRTVGRACERVVEAELDPGRLDGLVRIGVDEIWGEKGKRDLWQQLRRLPDGRWAKDFKGTRWALLKNPQDLTDRQKVQLARIRRNRGGIWRAYEMKEQFRAILIEDRRHRVTPELPRELRRMTPSPLLFLRSHADILL